MCPPGTAAARPRTGTAPALASSPRWPGTPHPAPGRPRCWPGDRRERSQPRESPTKAPPAPKGSRPRGSPGGRAGPGCPRGMATASRAGQGGLGTAGPRLRESPSLQEGPWDQGQPVALLQGPSPWPVLPYHLGDPPQLPPGPGPGSACLETPGVLLLHLGDGGRHLPLHLQKLLQVGARLRTDELKVDPENRRARRGQVTADVRSCRVSGGASGGLQPAHRQERQGHWTAHPQGSRATVDSTPVGTAEDTGWHTHGDGGDSGQHTPAGTAGDSGQHSRRDSGGQWTAQPQGQRGTLGCTPSGSRSTPELREGPGGAGEVLGQ